jgi:hypothetical protein
MTTLHTDDRPRQAPTGERAGVGAIPLALFSVLLEVGLITPWVDHLAESGPTLHFTQHGLIYLGGVLMGVALHKARSAVRRVQ